MWRALAAFVGLMLAAGIYMFATGAAADPSPAAATPGAPGAPSFGFALAAGAVALAATLLVTRPRIRMRR